MKAIVCKEFAPWESLAYEEVPDPVVGKGQVLVDVKAAGINFPDMLMVEGKYQVKPPTPFIPGAEVAGVVAEVGEGVSRFAVGDRVFGPVQIGAFAERVAQSEHAFFPMGESMSFEQAAGLALAYGTSYYALKQRAQLQPGETVLVLGAAGGVGIATVQLAKAMGAKVIAAASSDEKLEFAAQAGADEGINYSTEDLKQRTKELTGGKGANVVYDPVGGDYSEQAFRATAWDGRFLVIGFASGPIPKMPLNLALLKGSSLIGVFWGSWAAQFPDENRENLEEMVAMIDAGDFSPVVSETHDMENFADAFGAIAERRAKGKVVLTNS